MSQIVVGRKTRKKQSTFEKLWARATKLRAKNARFAIDLDAVVTRMENTIRPREIELARKQTPLLQKLLTLGQRKSMTNWERETLDEWIRELVQLTQVYGLVNDELLDDIARYDAFRMGVALEDESIPPHKQFVEMMEQIEEERTEYIRREKDKHEQNKQELRDMLVRDAEHDIEKQLDSILGPEPLQSKTDTMTEDLWADELESEQQRLSDEYRKKRTALREQMMEEQLANIDAMLDGDADPDEDDNFNFDDFNFDDFDEDSVSGDDSKDAGSSKEAPNSALSNDTFQRLFRAAAGKLHPDREPDSEVRKEKQRLMAELLKARKKGDLMTVLEMYETYVGEHEGFSKADQKSLTESLKQMIDELEVQEEEIAFQSPLHAAAYQLFYNPSRKKVDTAFAEHIKGLKTQEKEVEYQISTITSLKSLKPELEVRYEAAMFSHPSFEDLMRFV